MVIWDVAVIFKELGGVAGVIAHCARYAPLDIPPAPMTVYQWRNRNRISAEWLPVVLLGVLDLARPNQFDHLFTVVPSVPSLDFEAGDAL